MFEVELKLVGRRAEWLPVPTLEGARTAVLAFIAGRNPLGEHLGSSNWAGGDVRQRRGKDRGGRAAYDVVAHVSFNGRVWADGKRVWTPETRELTAEVVPAEQLSAELDGRRSWQAASQELTRLGYHQMYVSVGHEEWVRGDERVILRKDAAGHWSWIAKPSLDLAVSNGRVLVRGTGMPEPPEVSEAEAAKRIMLFPEVVAALRALVEARDEEPPVLTAAEWDAARAALAKSDGKAGA